MHERMVASALNAKPSSRTRQDQRLASPSLDSSDVLSGSVPLSSIGEFDGNGSGWVLFSPQLNSYEAIEENHTRDGLMESIKPLDLSQSAATEKSSNFLQTNDTTGNTGGLELPAHNGTGSFTAPSGNKLDLFERVNAWRIEQSELLSIDLAGTASSGWNTEKHGSSTVWQRLKENAESAVRGIERCIGWDDVSIDALFSKEFPAKVEDERLSDNRVHILRARERGPPDWEKRIMDNTSRKVQQDQSKMHSGLLAAVILRIFTWSRATSSESTHVNHSRQRYYYGAQNPIVQHVDQSYHLGVIQRSIATLTSTITANAWSESAWDTATTTSLGLAAA